MLRPGHKKTPPRRGGAGGRGCFLRAGGQAPAGRGAQSAATAGGALQCKAGKRRGGGSVAAARRGTVAPAGTKPPPRGSAGARRCNHSGRVLARGPFFCGVSGVRRNISRRTPEPPSRGELSRALPLPQAQPPAAPHGAQSAATTGGASQCKAGKPPRGGAPQAKAERLPGAGRGRPRLPGARRGQSRLRVRLASASSRRKFTSDASAASTYVMAAARSTFFAASDSSYVT